MDAWIRITLADNADDREADSLLAWLRNDRNVRNMVGWAPGPAGPEHLGAVTEIVVAGLGSGGAAVALINSFKAWIRTRRPEVSIEVRTSKGQVKVTTHDLSDLSDERVTPLLEQILRGDDEPAA